MSQANYNEIGGLSKNETIKLYIERLKYDQSFNQKLSNFNQINFQQESIDDNLFFEICQAIQNWNVQTFEMSLKAHSPQYNKILTSISHISFSRLNQLILTDCGINNVEAITWMNAPNLMAIQLTGNNLSNLNSFSQCNFKDLCSLSIQISSIQGFNLSKLSRMKSSKTTKRLHLKNQNILVEQNQKSIPSFMNSIIKLQSSQIEGLELQISKAQYQKNRLYYNKLKQSFLSKRGIKIFELWRQSNKVLQYRKRQQIQK